MLYEELVIQLLIVHLQQQRVLGKPNVIIPKASVELFFTALHLFVDVNLIFKAL